MEPYFQGWLSKAPPDGDVIHPILKFLVGVGEMLFLVYYENITLRLLVFIIKQS